MNPGSGFGSGSGFGQTPSSTFGSVPGFGATTSTPFNTSGSHAFGSGSTSGTGFGATSGSTSGGFGGNMTQGFGSAGQGSGSQAFGQNSGSMFGAASTSSLAFGSTSPATQALGTGMGSGASTFSSSASGFGTGSASSSGAGGSVFGASSFGKPSPAGTSVFGSGGSSAVFGGGGGTTSVFGATSSGSSFGTGSSGTSGFGGGPSSTSGFGTGLSTSGFGAGSSGFGTGTSSTSGFGTTGTTAFGTGSTSMSGFGTGATSTSGFSTTGTAFGTGSKSTSGFGTGSASNSSFGTGVTGSSGFSTGAGGSSSLFGGVTKTHPSTQGSSVFGGVTKTHPSTQGSSVFGGASAFGRNSSGSSLTGPASTSSSGAGWPKGSVFGGPPVSKPQGLDGTFGQPPASVAVVPSATGSSVFGGASTFGGKASSAGISGVTTVPSSVSTVFGTKSAGPQSVLGGVSQKGGASVFGGDSKHSQKQQGGSGVYDSPTKPVLQQASVFGGGFKQEIKQEPSQNKAFGVGQPESQPMLFPAAASVSKSSVFGGAQSNSGSTFASGASSSQLFGGQSKPTSTQKTSASSVFVGKMRAGGLGTESSGASGFGTTASISSGTSGFGTGSSGTAGFGTGNRDVKQTEKSSSQALSVFGGAGQESRESGAGFSGQADSSTGAKQHPEQKGIFGIFSKGSQKRIANDNEGARERKRGRAENTERENENQPSSSGSPEKVVMRRSSSVLEDISSRTTICVKGIPAQLNKGAFLRRHFSRFGKVERIFPTPSKGSAVIKFETHEAAAKAKKRGTKLPDQEKSCSIFWKSSGAEKSPSAAEGPQTSKRKAWKASPQPESVASEARELGRGYRTQLPSSVADELASMSRGDAEEEEGKYRKTMQKPRQHAERDTTRSTQGKTPPPSTSVATGSGSGTGTAKTTKVDAATVSSLYKMVATTTMDKVNILDARDKLMRQVLGKQSGSVHSKAFIGTCPDMCPEKERLYREEVRRLSIYEIIPGSSAASGSTSQVDHTRAVKEYSRSSADQDEPLPHELRPLPVLMMTMNYLLTEIADHGEDGKWAEWYDFLWNRTRSIRKDITQQQLCSLEVVELLEKCVRFHIYCSERLCMEDMMVFDDKINNENLTKCLQTLKELYADMENKHNRFCPCEAEFRAYMVLMNLNEGDTLREVQQLRQQVRDSQEISFAVKMYSALNSNNYVRFFRLLKKASFLNACILHRYFNQIRARALQIILRSHRAGAKKVGFPLSELMRLLAFEREEELREFCAYYGLRAEGLDLVLDRSAYVEPESSIPSWRAVGLVESKRMVSVGEVINGKPLEPLYIPPPQCSFDAQGRFVAKLEGVADSAPVASTTVVRAPVVTTAEEKVKPFAVKPVTTPAPLQPSPLQLMDVSNEVVKMIARELFWEIIDESARTIAESCVAFCQQVSTCAVEVADQLVTSETSNMAREISTEVIADEKERRVQAAETERKARQDRAAADVTTLVINEFLDDQIKQVAQHEIEEAEAQAEAERRERCVLAISQDLVRDVTAEMSLQVADEVHQVDVVARLQLFADLQKAVELRRVSKWLSIWRKALLVRQRQKRAMLDFPCAPPMGPASKRLKEMFPDRPAHLSALLPGKAALMVNDRAHVTLLSPLEAEQRSLSLTAHLSLASLLSSLQRTRAWQPLNLGPLLRAPVLQCVQAWPDHLVKEFVPMGLQWKLLLSLPGEAETEDDNDTSDDDMTGVISKHGDLLAVLKQWLCAKMTHGEGNMSPGGGKQQNILSRYSMELAAVPGSTSRLRLSVCVRNVPEFSGSKDKSASAEQRQNITKATSAILFLLPHADTTDDIKWLEARLRLARLLEAKPMLPPTPLVLLLPCSPSTPTPSPTLTADATQRMGIEGFQEQGLVSDVAVVELPVKMGQPAGVVVASQILQKQVTEAVKFLASKMPAPPDMRCQRLGDLVEDTLTQHFFTPVLQDLRLRQQRNKLHQAPNAIISLYNTVLDHIAMALTSPALQDISWPAPELQQSAEALDGIPSAEWNSRKHLADVYELVANLRLPWFQYKDPLATDWGQVCSDVWAFVDGVVKKRCDSAVSLTTRISNILARACLQFETECNLTQSEDHCTPTYVNAPWSDIILACVDFRLKRLHNWKEEEEEMGGDVEVFYEEEDLEEFEPPAAWVQALLDTEDLESHRVEETVEQAAVLHFASKNPTKDYNYTANNTHQNSSDDEDNITTDNDDSNISGMETTNDHTANKTLAEAAQEIQQLPDNMRSAYQTSQTLLLHVEEEKNKTRAFQDYLEKALKGETLPETDAFGIVPESPSAMQTPGLSFTASGQASGTRRNDSHQLTPWLTPARTTPQQPSQLFPRRLMQSQPMTTSLREEVAGEAKKPFQEHEPISQRLEELKENLQAQRYASQLYEKRLQSFLES